MNEKMEDVFNTVFNVFEEKVKEPVEKYFEYDNSEKDCNYSENILNKDDKQGN